MVYKFLILVFCGFILIGESRQDVTLNRKTIEQFKELRPLGVEFFHFIQNITVDDIKIITGRVDQQDIDCLSDLRKLLQDLSDNKLWAIKMIDAWGSLPSGIISGNTIDLGNYDQCYKIDRQSDNDDYHLKGKYCLASLPLGKLIDTSENSFVSSITIETAICFPASCSATHMDTVLRQLFKTLLNIDYSYEIELVNEETCKYKGDSPLDGLSIFAIALYVVLAVVCGVITIYDYWLGKKADKMPQLMRILSCKYNSDNLMHTEPPNSKPNVIDCLHGIRVLSLLWVIYGHEYAIAMRAPNTNEFEIYTWLESFLATYIIHAPFAVDTFFFISGLLVSKIALSYMEKNEGKLNIIKMYVHRYLRLTPLLIMAMLVYWKLLPYMGDGPIYDNKVPDNFSNCAKTWWMNLMYIQNYATTDYCLGHSWFLAVDMQLYILSPILLIALYKWGKKAVAGVVVLILLLSACLFGTMMIGGYSLFVKNITVISESHPKIYRATHTHAAPWLIGALFGYFVNKTKGKKFQLGRITVWLGWLISLALFSTCLFALFPASKWDAPNLSRLADASYYTLTRLAWPLGLCWLVFACMNGYGGMINGLLSHPSWQPLSKLSYSAYIWHKCVQTINNRTMRGNTFFSDYNVLLSFWTTFGFTLLFAYEMHLLVEAPVIGLERILGPKKKPVEAKQEEISVEVKQEEISVEATQSPPIESNPDAEVAPADSTEITNEST